MLCFYIFSYSLAADKILAADRVDSKTLTGKVFCGYQGWFSCDGDGANLGWAHWAKHGNQPFAPGNVCVDLWPDVSEYDADERFATRFKRADGRFAEVFSSSNRKTVLRHFQWMQEYGIDGAFVQRFANGLRDPNLLHQKNSVLSHARAGAEQTGRAFAVMYDLSGLAAGAMYTVREDWKVLQTGMKITENLAYLHHKGRPVVAVWGVGFNDNRSYSLSECLKLLQWLKAEGCTVMLGVPSFWREGRRDAVDDPLLLELLKQADIVSPWTVGRYRTPEEARQHAKLVWQPDRDWCEGRRIDFLPVVYPGFSWHNLKGDRLGDIPRLKGQFLWSQLAAAKRTGCEMIYVAMFDEVDEGTAIFKCTNDPPTGNGAKFLNYEQLPSDFYLRLVGEGGKMLRGERPVTEALPIKLQSSR